MKQRRVINHDVNVKLRRKYRSVIIVICPHHLIFNRTIDMYFSSKILKRFRIEKHSHPYIFQNKTLLLYYQKSIMKQSKPLSKCYHNHIL